MRLGHAQRREAGIAQQRHGLEGQFALLFSRHRTLADLCEQRFEARLQRSVGRWIGS
ncbi:hypothetical protein NWF32_25175 [Pseudomonas qingdaonensis]|nr:hypothetical protein [Pseudomonas qingdaonensis]